MLLYVPIERVQDSTKKKSPEFGIKVRIDTQRRYMPEMFEIFTNFNGEERRLRQITSELEEVKKGVWMPVRGKTLTYHLVGEKAGELQTSLSMEVDVNSSSWNPKVLDKEFLQSSPDSTAKKRGESHDGWETWTATAAPSPAESVPSRRVLFIVANVSAIALILVLLILKRRQLTLQ